MLIVEGAKTILENARYKLVRMGEMYYALINTVTENGEYEITFKPLNKISELVRIPVRYDE